MTNSAGAAVQNSVAENAAGEGSGPDNGPAAATSASDVERGSADRFETPSGKNEKTENFPVGSFLLAPEHRPHVATYYAFARAIDDIADDPALPAFEKISRLRGYEAALVNDIPPGEGYDKATALRSSMVETGVPTKHGVDLVAAFIQDAEKNRYATWDELLGYCALSANPVGRYLLDLHGEDPQAYRYSDALCTVLQIVNHLQDCREDLDEIDRVYVIGNWMTKESVVVDDIAGAQLTPGLRKVVDQMLDGCDALMQDARKLPSALQSKRLAMESAVIVRIADRLIALLRAQDPLAMRVKLSKFDVAVAGLSGSIAGFFSSGKGA